MTGNSAVERAHITNIAIACGRIHGPRALADLVSLAARETDADTVLIASVHGVPEGRLQRRALWREGALCEGGEYVATGTPCAAVISDGSTQLGGEGVVIDHPALESQHTLRAYHGVAIRDADGAVRGVLAVMHHDALPADPLRGDVLEILAARAASLLQEVASCGEDEVYRLMFNTSLDGLVLMNSQGIVVDHNPALSKIDGFSREEIIGQYPPRFRDPSRHCRTPGADRARAEW